MKPTPVTPAPAADPRPVTGLAVGVDIAKASFVAACWWPEQDHGEVLDTFANTPEGFAALAERLQARCPHGTLDGAPPLHVVLEPTGGAELPLALFALQQGWLVSRPNPAQVRDWGRGLGRRAKTDQQDALLLAQYGAQRQPPAWRPLAAELSELESLQRRKEELETMLQQERNRLHQLLTRPHVAPAVPQSVRRLVETLEEELRGVQTAIAAVLAHHPPLQAARTRLLSLPGIGPATVIPLLLLLARWDTLTDGKGRAEGLVAYAGLDPQPYQSGTSVHRRATISRKGSHVLRRQLFMGVLGGVRGRNPLRGVYWRLVGRGKPKMLALVAAMRKLVVWAWAVYRSGQPFDPTKLAHLTASYA
jgi:transposase